MAVLSLTWKSPYVDKTVFILRRGPASLCACGVLVSFDMHITISNLIGFKFVVNLFREEAEYNIYQILYLIIYTAYRYCEIDSIDFENWKKHVIGGYFSIYHLKYQC